MQDFSKNILPHQTPYDIIAKVQNTHAWRVRRCARMPLVMANNDRAEEKTGGITIMAVVSMKQLLEAGVHFGHQTRRWNPKMARFIFTERNGIYIIDLQKTVKKMDEAYNFVRDLAAEGGKVLFVGTKKQAKDSIKAEAVATSTSLTNVGSAACSPTSKRLKLVLNASKP